MADIRGGLALLFSPLLLTPLLATACTTHQCDPSTVVIDDSDGGAGTLTRNGTELVWQSSPPTGPLVPFSGEETITIRFPAGFRYPFEYEVYSATDPYPADAGTLTPGSGQLGELTFAPDGSSMTLTNASCADYYVYVVLHAWAADAGAGAGVDAAADAHHD